MRYYVGMILVWLVAGCVHPTKSIEVREENRVESNIQEPMLSRDYDENLYAERVEIQSDSDNSTNGLQESQQLREKVEQVPSFDKSRFKSLKITANNKKREKIVVRGGNVKVNVESIPLNEFVDFIFSSVLNVNYSVANKVKALKQPITLNMSKVLPKQKLFNVVEKILKNESVILVHENDTIFVKLEKSNVVKDNISDKYIVFGKKIPASIPDDKKVMVFVPYSYIPPKSSFKILKRLGVGHVYFSYIKGDIQILDGKAKDVRQTLQMIEVLDSTTMVNKTPYLLNLDHIEVEKFTKEITTILKKNGIPIANTISNVGIVLSPIKELNSLLVITSKREWLEMIEFWQGKLDVVSEVSEKPKLYVYNVRYRKADELASVLSSISINNLVDSSSVLDGNRTKKSRRSLNITADLHTNSLMIYATYEEYKKVLDIIKKLDKQALQVLVEVTVAEVDLTNSFSLGFEWSILNNKALSGVTSKVADGAVSLNLSGTSGIVARLFKTNVTSLINAFAKDKKLDILSRPSLLILNNKTGSINVGEQVPVVSSEVSAGDLNSGGSTPSILRNISYRNTGIIVNLTPTINSNGTLTLDTHITLSEAQTDGSLSPLIINRNVSTSIIMHSGDSVLIGGLISHSQSQSNSGVPLLKDIPYIGELFKGRSSSHKKTELIILLKPTIINSRLELNNETYKFKALLKTLKNL